MRLFLSAAALAAALPVQAGPAAAADPGAPVPPPVYHSVFPSGPAPLPAEEPDWKRANAEVARFPRGHVDLLRWEQAQPATQAPPWPQAPDRRHQMAPLLQEAPAPAPHHPHHH